MTHPRVATGSSPLDILWRGHVFLFGKRPQRATYGDTAGLRLLLIVVGVEALRLVSRSSFLVLPLWLAVSLWLLAALLAVRVFAGVSWAQIGFIRWREWTAIETSYLVQVVVLINIVFPLMFTEKLRAALADPVVIGSVFVPYFAYGFYQEVVYRGLLQTELVRRWGPMAGILISNTVFTFGPLHYYYFRSSASTAVPMFASIFAIGLVFAVVFHRTGNLWIPAIMHAFGNAYVVGLFGRDQ